MNNMDIVFYNISHSFRITLVLMNILRIWIVRLFRCIYWKSLMNLILKNGLLIANRKLKKIIFSKYIKIVYNLQ